MTTLSAPTARPLAATAVILALAGCGSSHTAPSSTSRASSSPGNPASAQAEAHRTTTTARPAAAAATLTSWSTFDVDAQRSGLGPRQSGIDRGNIDRLTHRVIRINGVVDSSVIEAANVTVDGRRRDVIAFTTDYGSTDVLDADTGRQLWSFAPADTARLRGGPQITTATPVLDASRRVLYAASPDGVVHELSLTDGHQLWSSRVTDDPSHEKIAGALNLADGELIVTTGGYVGDIPPYVGHVETLDPSDGRITHVFNTLCSNVHTIIRNPAGCHYSDSAIWGRPGSVVLPGSGDILIATSNGAFNGTTNWGDSVLELSPQLRLLHNWTPRDQEALNVDDTDLGSTEPALLPERDGQHDAVQGGKDGMLHVLDLDRLDGTTHGAGPRTGGEVQDLPSPGHGEVLAQPAVDGSLVLVADSAGTAAYRFSADARLTRQWANSAAGTSPIISGGLLYVYDQQAGALNVYLPATGHRVASLSAAPGHWNSPTVLNGHIYLPVGNDNAHADSGELEIWTAPGT